MNRIAITLLDNAPVQAALFDCARSLAAGFMSGSLSGHEENEDWGTWTSDPMMSETYDITIDANINGGQINKYFLAGAVYQAALQYTPDQVFLVTK